MHPVLITPLTHSPVGMARVGTALITVATGSMSEAEEERAGLVKTHAYAVLSMVEVKGLKLLQLKNPWSHRRWKVSISYTK